VNGVAARLDPDPVVLRVDVDAVASRIDLDALIARVDPDSVAKRLDVDAVVARVDLDAIVARLDLPRIALEVIAAIDLPEIVRESTGSAASEVVRGIRVESVQADDAVARIVDRLLHRAELRPFVGEGHRPGRQVGGDVALRNAAHRDRPMLGHLGTPQSVAQRITAGGQSDGKNRDRAQKDGAAVLQLLDHGMKTRAFVRIYEQPPVTIAGLGCDEPCNYSDELSEVK